MENLYDLIIIGAGPSGLTAGIYGGRAKLKTLIINKGNVGGMVDTTREIVNYPGTINATGPELMEQWKKHAEAFGVEFLKDEVVAVDFSQEIKVIKTKKKKEFSAKSVIIGCGCEPRLLNIPGEKELRGSGVAYCATCDAEFFQDEHVVVVGSGDQAIEEGMFITKFASKVTVIVLHDEGRLDCNKISAEKAFANEKMNFVWNSTIAEVVGEDNVEGVMIKNIKSGETSRIDCQGVFFFVGMIPATKFLQNSGLELDQRGYFDVKNMMETNIKGIYAVGDNRNKYLRQVVTAASDGAIAAVAAERYIDELDSFNENVLNSDKKVMLVFFNAMIGQSLEFCTLIEDLNSDFSDVYKVVKVDMATKKNMAEKYGVENVPAVVITEKGEKIRELNCTMDKDGMRCQL